MEGRPSPPFYSLGEHEEDQQPQHDGCNGPDGGAGCVCGAGRRLLLFLLRGGFELGGLPTGGDHYDDMKKEHDAVWVWKGREGWMGV